MKKLLLAAFILLLCFTACSDPPDPVLETLHKKYGGSLKEDLSYVALQDGRHSILITYDMPAAAADAEIADMISATVLLVKNTPDITDIASFAVDVRFTGNKGGIRFQIAENLKTFFAESSVNDHITADYSAPLSELEEEIRQSRAVPEAPPEPSEGETPESEASEAVSSSPESPSANRINSLVDDGRFTFSAPGVLEQFDWENELINSTVSDFYTENDTRVYWKLTRLAKLFVYTDAASEQVTAITIQTSADHNKSEQQPFMQGFVVLVAQCGIQADDAEIRAALSLDAFNRGEATTFTSDQVTIHFTWDNEVIRADFFPAGSKLSPERLSQAVKADQDPLIGDKEALKHLLSLSKQLSYSDFTAYLKENGNPKSEFSQELSAKASEIMGMLDGCDIIHDNFANESRIYYGGMQTISDECNIVPYIQLTRSGISLYKTWGFTAPDWLYFNEVKIKVGDDKYIWNTYEPEDMEREALDGAICEKNSRLFMLDDARQIADFDGLPTIRFINSGNKQYRDHTFSETEKKAVETLYAIHTANREITDTLYGHTAYLE